MPRSRGKKPKKETSSKQQNNHQNNNKQQHRSQHYQDVDEIMEIEKEKQENNEIINVDNEEEELDDEEETQDFGPEFNPTHFQFLIDEKPEKFYEGEFQLNRPFKASQNFLENPHGSVKLFQGDTCALCAVYGPTEIRMSKELPHRAGVDVLFRPKITGTSALSQITGWDSTIEERAVEAKLTGILESVLFLEDDMGAGFNIILHEFENDGCLFSTCINATALALLNAGCSMRCTFAAVTILVNETTNSIIVDPSQLQINTGFDALLTFVLSNDGHVLFTSLQGRTTCKLIRLCLRQANEACKEIFKFQKQLQVQDCADFANSRKYFKPNSELKSEDVVKVKMEDMKIDSDVESDENYEDVEDGEVSSDS